MRSDTKIFCPLMKATVENLYKLTQWRFNETLIKNEWSKSSDWFKKKRMNKANKWSYWSNNQILMKHESINEE